MVKRGKKKFKCSSCGKVKFLSRQELGTKSKPICEACGNRTFDPVSRTAKEAVKIISNARAQVSPRQKRQRAAKHVTGVRHIRVKTLAERAEVREAASKLLTWAEQQGIMRPDDKELPPFRTPRSRT